MDIDYQQQHSYLFTVRLWKADVGEGRTEWRGNVRYVISGERHYFREWPRLISLLQAMLPEPGPYPDASKKAEDCHDHSNES